jgi:hypothetical protein
LAAAWPAGGEEERFVGQHLTILERDLPCGTIDRGGT